MQINKHNYEEYFLLYTDNELNEQQRKAVECFVDENPQLKEELDGLLQARLPFETNEILFDKTSLYKPVQDNATINTSNYEAYLLLYVDNELNAEEKKSVETFVAGYEPAKKELALLSRGILSPDSEIVFADKSVLYKKEERVVPMFNQWRRMVAAASIILIGGLVWMNMDAIQKPFEQTGGGSLATLDTNTKNSNPTIDNSVEQNSKVSTPQPEDSPIVTSEDKTVPQSLNKENKELVAKSDTKEKQVSAENKASLDANKPEKNGSVVKVNDHFAESSDNNKAIQVLTPATDLAITSKKVEEEPVKPFKISQAAFNGEEDKEETTEESINKNTEGIAFLDTDQPEEKSKGNFRGLVRKASRFINRNKAENKQEDDSVIRIASFAIAKK